jgi:TolB-like protein/tetratricopeptide (TPR) repeat protein
MGSSPSANSSGPGFPQTREDAASEAAVRTELEKVLSSKAFHGSESLKRFLRYAVEHTLQGEGDQLKEYRLGVEVLDRPTSFDPRMDPVVRMTARRLRVKLREYYETEGRQDGIRVEVPKGSYGATFVPNTWQKARDAGGLEEPRSRQRQFALLAVILLFAAALAAVYWARTPRPSHAAAQGQVSSIAVLPFLNLSGSLDDDYLSDGLTDELTGALAKLPGLRVVARTSAFKFKGKADDVRVIGSQLNVASLVEGSLQKSEGRLRVTVQLVRTADGYHMWSETYERSAADAFAVEDEITRTIAGALQLRLGEETAEPRAQKRPVDPLAHDLYLQGRYWWNKRTPANEWKAIRYFNQALEKDPLYAEAYLGLAEAYVVLGANDQAAPEDVNPKARAAAEQALRLDESLSEAHATLAQATFFHGWDFKRSEQEFRRAIELNPNHATAHQWYGIQLMLERRFDEALREFAQAQQLDPLSLILGLDEGQVYYYSGRQDAAIAQARKALAHSPNFPAAHDLLGMAYERKQQFKEAIAEFQKYLVLSDHDPEALMRLAVTYAELGDRARALKMVGEMEKAIKGSYVPSYDIASVYATLGDEERALAWLDRAIGQRSSSCLLLGIDPAFDAFRADAGFQDRLRKIGLPVS